MSTVLFVNATIVFSENLIHVIIVIIPWYTFKTKHIYNILIILGIYITKCEINVFIYIFFVRRNQT